jgi:hypothetical protein
MIRQSFVVSVGLVLKVMCLAAQVRQNDSKGRRSRTNCRNLGAGFNRRAPWLTDQNDHVIYHYPEVALDPNSIGTKQSRPYKFDAEKLTFSDKDTAPGVASYAISWKKMRSP